MTAGKVPKREVGYRRAGQTARKRCGTCSMFRPDYTPKWGSCTLVDGFIRAGDVCDRWEAKK